MRSIIEGEAFANAKFRICPYAEDLDEYLEGTFELLARDPEQGMDIGVPSAPSSKFVPTSGALAANARH